MLNISTIAIFASGRSRLWKLPHDLDLWNDAGHCRLSLIAFRYVKTHCSVLSVKIAGLSCFRMSKVWEASATFWVQYSGKRLHCICFVKTHAKTYCHIMLRMIAYVIYDIRHVTYDNPCRKCTYVYIYIYDYILNCKFTFMYLPTYIHTYMHTSILSSEESSLQSLIAIQGFSAPTRQKSVWLRHWDIDKIPSLSDQKQGKDHQFMTCRPLLQK